jgi:hypothetical protein
VSITPTEKVKANASKAVDFARRYHDAGDFSPEELRGMEAGTVVQVRLLGGERMLFRRAQGNGRSEFAPILGCNVTAQNLALMGAFADVVRQDVEG